MRISNLTGAVTATAALQVSGTEEGVQGRKQAGRKGRQQGSRQSSRTAREKGFSSHCGAGGGRLAGTLTNQRKGPNWC